MDFNNCVLLSVFKPVLPITNWVMVGEYVYDGGVLGERNHRRIATESVTCPFNENKKLTIFFHASQSQDEF